MPIPEFGRFAEPALLILVSLSDGPKHGYAIMADVEEGTGRPMGPGTLYAALARLDEQGLVVALPPENRRRPYRLTAIGATTLAEQLQGLSAFAKHGLQRLSSGDAVIGLLLRPLPRRVASPVRRRVRRAARDPTPRPVRRRRRRPGRHRRPSPPSGPRCGPAPPSGVPHVCSKSAASRPSSAAPCSEPGSCGRLPTRDDSDPGGFVALVSIIVILVGLVGLSAFQARRHPALVWAASSARPRRSVWRS